MAPIGWSDVLDVAAELATGVSLTAQAKFVNLANERVSVSAFGGENSATLNLARSYVAAHFALMHKRGSTGIGAVTSKSEGGASISFANLIIPSSSPFGQTPYGQAFLALVSASPEARAGFVTGFSGVRRW